MGNYKAWKKALGFVFIGIAIALIFTLTDTYSLYQNKGEGDGQVIAASREDIVKNIEIIYEDHIPILRLEKGNGVDYSPIIFFSLEGELEDYVLHINSVKLDGIEETPIVPNVNLPQAMSLLIGPKEELTGTLRIKHLNEFIDEAIDISLSKEYLLSRYFYDRGLENYSKDYLSYKEKGELIDLIKGSLFYAEKYLEWERVEWEEDYNWISKVNVSNNQMELIDTIAPNLLEYNERLYEVFEIVLEDLMKEIEKNNILTRENAELLSEIKELSSETEELRGEINSLYGHVSVLEAQINELTSMLNSQPAPEDSEEPNSQEELGEPKSDINLPID